MSDKRNHNAALIEPWVTELEYQVLEQQLARAGSVLSAAECHGLLSALLCVRGAELDAEWFSEVLDEEELSAAVYAESCRVLRELQQSVLAALNNESLDFALCVPDDAGGLAERTEALADWCQGFVYGVGISGVKKSTRLPEDVQGLIQDFTQISHAGLSGDDAEDEASYAELIEYVRVGVLLMYEELHPVTPGKHPLN